MNASDDLEFLEWGDVGGCGYLTTSRLDMASFLASFRECLEHRLVWITAFDSGPLKLSDEERSRGWSMLEQIAISPPVRAEVELPHEHYDEWWIDVQDHTALRDCRFCNYLGFALAGVAKQEDEADPTWDVTPLQAKVRLQREFWIAFWKSQAEMYICDGDLFNFVCYDRKLFRRVLDHAQRHRLR